MADALKLLIVEARFYDQLRTREKRLYYVSAGHGLSGPWVALYQI